MFVVGLIRLNSRFMVQCSTLYCTKIGTLFHFVTENVYFDYSDRDRG